MFHVVGTLGKPQFGILRQPAQAPEQSSGGHHRDGVVAVGHFIDGDVGVTRFLVADIIASGFKILAFVFDVFFESFHQTGILAEAFENGVIGAEAESPQHGR